MDRRVVISGLGVVTSLGWDVDEFWSNISQGRSGVSRITGFDPSRSRCQIGSEVTGFDGASYFENSRDAKRAELFIQYSVSASKIASKDAGIDFDRIDPERAGAYIGTGVGGLQTVENAKEILLTRGPGKVSPFVIPMMIGNAAGGIVAMDLGITGPSLCVTSACATGTHAVGEAWKTIKLGDAEVMIAGGSESTITELLLLVLVTCGRLALATMNPKKHRGLSIRIAMAS